jgi:hypothetical protein
MTNENGFIDFGGIIMSIFVMIVIIGVVVFYLQWNPFVPITEIYGTNITDTITISGKIYDANNNWYEIITTDSAKYLTNPPKLSEQFEINHTYLVIIQKSQMKINLQGGSWHNTTYITSLSEIAMEGIEHDK